MSNFETDATDISGVIANDYGDSEPSAIDLREVYAAIYRSRVALIAIVVTCLVLGIVITVLTTKQYEGEATVEVRQEAEKILGTEQDREGAASKVDVERFLETQIDLVSSRVVTTAVAEELGLFRGDAFLETMNVDYEPSPDGVLTEQEAKRNLIIGVLKDNLSISYTGETRLLNIVFISPSPRLSARVANAFADNYIRSNLQRKSDSSSYALDFLRGQLREAQIRLEESERAALEYARRTRIVDVSNAAGGSGSQVNNQPQSLITAQLVQLNQAYSTAVSERVAAEQRWRRTQSSQLLNIPEVLANPAVQGLLEQRATLEADYRQQLATRQEDFPAVRQASARFAEIDRQVTALAQNIRNSVQNQYEIALQREKQLQRQIDDLKGNTLVEQNQSIQLSILRRQADTNRQQSESLLLRYNQLNAESGVQANNLAIVDRAVVDPNPAWPKIPLNLALALVGGFVLSALYLIVHLQLFDKIRTAVDVTDRLGMPILGAIPFADNVLEEMNDQKSEISEAFNLVRTGLSLSSEGGIPRTAMVTSVQAAEGKSSTCLSLAIGFARLGKRVLLIDLDMRRPNVHRLLDLSNKIGASSVLSGQVPAEQAVQRTAHERLDVITGGPIPPGPTDLIMGRQLDSFLEELGRTYDIIMVDSPPVLALADAGILASRMEATMFVIESGRNSRKAVQNAVTRIRRNGANVVGVVLTKYDPGELGYGSYDDYSYVYRYDAREQTDD